MKKTFLLVIALALLCGGYAQGVKRFPKGIYMTIDDIRNMTPSQEASLTWSKRSKSDIKMSGGNDYKVTCDDKSVTKKAILNDVLAYSDGRFLIINCKKYGLDQWYALVESAGRYLAFIGGLSRDEAMQEMQIGAMFGAVVGGIQGAYLATLRYVYIVDTTNNQLTFVNRAVMQSLLADYEDLIAAFEAETDPDNDTYIRYLKLLNERKEKK